jgi:hypothetical protein
LKLKDIGHSNKFIHLNPVISSFLCSHWFTFSLSHTLTLSHTHYYLIFLKFLCWFEIGWLIDWFDFIELIYSTQYREILKKVLNNVKFQRIQHSHTLKVNFEMTEIPNSISTLTHLHTFKLIGNRQKVNLNSITSLHNQIQTCIIGNVHLTPNLNDTLNPIYTLTKLQHLELIGCGISELNETIKKDNSFSHKTFYIHNHKEIY